MGNRKISFSDRRIQKSLGLLGMENRKTSWIVGLGKSEQLGGGHGVVSASSSAPQGASSGPPPSCWGSPSKVDEFERVGCTKSHQNRT